VAVEKIKELVLRASPDGKLRMRILISCPDQNYQCKGALLSTLEV
jgi:hypothetical protein